MQIVIVAMREDRCAADVLKQYIFRDRKKSKNPKQNKNRQKHTVVIFSYT